MNNPLEILVTNGLSLLGFMNGGKLPYKDESGFDLNSQVLVFKVTLPHGAEPLAR